MACVTFICFMGVVGLFFLITYSSPDGKFGDLALHFLNKYKIMGVRVMSKYDLRRLARATGATALPRLTPPTKAELGHCDNVSISEVRLIILSIPLCLHFLSYFLIPLFLILPHCLFNSSETRPL